MDEHADADKPPRDIQIISFMGREKAWSVGVVCVNVCVGTERERLFSHTYTRNLSPLSQTRQLSLRDVHTRTLSLFHRHTQPLKAQESKQIMNEWPFTCLIL